MKDVIDADAGTYSCNATNSIGSTVSQAATVKIYKGAEIFGGARLCIVYLFS